MRQPLFTFGPVFADREAIAQMFSLDPALLDITLLLEVCRVESLSSLCQSRAERPYAPVAFDWMPRSTRSPIRRRITACLPWLLASPKIQQ